MSGYPLTLLLILGAWALIAAAALGCGLALRRAFRPGPLTALDLIPVFWTGWAIILGFLQIWHLWLPVGGAALVVVAALGAVGLALEARPLLELSVRVLRGAPGAALLLAVAVLWAANRSGGPAQFYDIGLYYMQAVAWASSYPIVPGLANLHARLGFNSAYFLYAALMDAGPFAGKALYSTNGPLLLALLAQGLAGAVALFAGTWPRRTAFWHALTLTPALYYIFGLEGNDPNLPAILMLNGLAPDMGAFVLGLALSGLLAQLLLEPVAMTAAGRAYLRGAVAVVACAGVAVKLSFAAYGVAAIAVAYGAAIAWERPRTARAWLALSAPAAAAALTVVGVSAVRGVILSGYPFFPSTFAAAPVPWRVPKIIAVDNDLWVRSWARQQKLHWSEVLGSNAWLRTWLLVQPPLLTRPLAIAVLAGAGLLASLTRASVTPRGLARGALFLLPPAVSLIFWFITAPEQRFLGAALWALALGLALLLAERLRLALASSSAAAPLVATLLLLVTTAPVRQPLIVMPDPATPDGLPVLPAPATSALTTDHGLVLRVPESGDQCWAVQIPCTPNFDQRLRTVRPGDLGSGLVLDPPPSDVNFAGGPPQPVRAPADLGVIMLSGWHGYEPDAGQRWMAESGVLLLFSERPREIVMGVVVGAMREGDGFGDKGRLLAKVGGRTYPVDLVAGQEGRVKLPLGSGFTRVDLLLEAGSLVPAEVIPGSGDTRPLSILVRELNFSDE